jgi:hypothetical protein
MHAYRFPSLDDGWAETRETHPGVAAAIHAIADSSRSPEAIWEEPTLAEIDHVTMALQSYVEAGLIEAAPDDRYDWGAEPIVMNFTKKVG